jgi:uncharacterized protein YidB (DUF937 family)
MDFNELFKMGAELIQNNSDDATTGLDADAISNALGGILSGEDGSLDLSSLAAKLTDGDFGEMINSWFGNGENMPMDVEQVSALLGSEKVEAFADQLGLNFESASQALADALPNVIDQATSGDNSIVDDLLAQVGGAQGAMNMLGKMFG